MGNCIYILPCISFELYQTEVTQKHMPDRQITAVLYILSIVLGAKDVSLFVKLPEFLFGMYFIKL